MKTEIPLKKRYEPTIDEPKITALSKKIILRPAIIMAVTMIVIQRPRRGFPDEILATRELKIAIPINDPRRAPTKSTPTLDHLLAAAPTPAPIPRLTHNDSQTDHSGVPEGMAEANKRQRSKAAIEICAAKNIVASKCLPPKNIKNAPRVMNKQAKPTAYFSKKLHKA